MSSFFFKHLFLFDKQVDGSEGGKSDTQRPKDITGTVW